MQYLRGSFEQRSKEIIKESDYFIIIHDGESKGTSNELELVKKSKKEYHYEILDKAKFNKSIGFNIVNDWGEQINDWGEI